MLMSRIRGVPNSASCNVSSRDLRRFFPSATWAMMSGFSSSRISRDIFSCSDSGIMLSIPGVSMR